MAALTSLPAYLLSPLYKTAAWIHWQIRASSRRTFPAYIISVDNLSFGGTGKTPLVLLLGKTLQEHRRSFAIITRGYHSEMEKTGGETTTEHTPQQTGDEAVLFKRRFPTQGVFVGANRIASIERAIQKGFKILILDDGFQSPHIRRDLKILLYNPTQPDYYFRHFRGMMKHEDVILVYDGENDTGSPVREMNRMRRILNPTIRLGSYGFVAEGFVNASGQPVNLSEKRIIGFSGLGDNRRFRRDLEKNNLVEFIEFPDHWSYRDEDLKKLETRRRALNADYMVCTEKDFIKLRNTGLLASAPFIYAQNSIKLEFHPVEMLAPVLTHAAC